MVFTCLLCVFIYYKPACEYNIIYIAQHLSSKISAVKKSITFKLIFFHQNVFLFNLTLIIVIYMFDRESMENIEKKNIEVAL